MREKCEQRCGTDHGRKCCVPRYSRKYGAVQSASNTKGLCRRHLRRLIKGGHPRSPFVALRAVLVLADRSRATKEVP